MKCESCQNQEATTTRPNPETVDSRPMRVCADCAGGIDDNDAMLAEFAEGKSPRQEYEQY